MWTGLIRRFSAEESKVCGECETGSDDDDDQVRDGVNGVFAPAGRRAGRASPFRPPPLEPLVLHGHCGSTPSCPSGLLTAAVAEEIRTMVPERLRIAEDWRLIYSLEQDGASLATLYHRCRVFEGHRAGFVLVVKDQDGGVSVMFLGSSFLSYLSLHYSFFPVFSPLHLFGFSLLPYGLFFPSPSCSLYNYVLQLRNNNNY